MSKGFDMAKNAVIQAQGQQFSLLSLFLGGFYFTGLVERRVTSWAPPSTMDTEETRVSLASRCRSGMVMTPQVHLVDLTFYREASTLSCRGPA